MRKVLKGMVCVSALLPIAPAYAADYVTTVNGLNPLAYFRLTAPGTPSTVNGYTTSYTVTTGTTAPGGGAPIAADPANTAATFAGDNANPSEVFTSLSGGIPGAGTINAWINLAVLPSVAGHVFAIAGESQFGNDFDFQIETDNVLHFYTGGGENTAYALPLAGVVGSWHMVTASYAGGANGFRNLYFDGELAASFTGGVSAAAKTSGFSIGYNDTFGGRDFTGAIDEVAVWGRGLSADEIGTIYASAAVPAASAAPEPASWAMLIAGFGMIGGALRGRRTPVSA